MSKQTVSSMSKQKKRQRKEKSLAELYSITQEISVAESSHQPISKCSRRSASESVSMGNEAASCIEVKTENELSDEASQVKAATTGSFNNENKMPFYKEGTHADRKPTASETSNFISTSSTLDSIMENVESNEALRKKKEDIEMLSNASKDQVISSSNKCIESSVSLGSAGDIPPAVYHNEHLEINRQNDKSRESILKNQDPPLTSQSNDGSNGSDMLEVDVKVCDICGDIGRENLLVICSRCSDGAEHIYCMRIMMKKVPECYWLCEVCQMKEDAANQKKDKCENVLGTLNVLGLSKKNKVVVSALDSRIPLKPDARIPRLSSKRHADNLEISLATKCQALESGAGPQWPSCPNKMNTLSSERSLKDVDKWKVKPVHPVPSFGGQSSQHTTHSQKSSKIQPLHQSAQCSLFKSSSFNTSDLKQRVKLIQDVPQKKKASKLPSMSGRRKDDTIRKICKSSSFKIGSSQVTSSEFKHNLISPNIVRGEDLRETRLGKERKTIERKDSFKSDNMVSPRAALTLSSPKDGQKVSSPGKTLRLPSATTGLRDLKVVQADERALSKVTNPLPHKSSVPPTGHGNFKRQYSLASRSDAYPTVKGNPAEQKPALVNPNDKIATNLSSDGTSRSLGLVSHDDMPDSCRPVDQDNIIEETSCSQSSRSVSVAYNCIRSSNLHDQDFSVSVCSNISSIPAPDCIWKGGFAVQSSNGRHLESVNEIQAHLSTTASPKVIEAVNKLTDSIQLEEVSRPSIWPTQFQNGVTEDNIALYFFPQNVERSYDRLVKHLMNNDLALKGVVNGVELLIIPSNQLCDNSKRWNVFYFLWGVFRAKQENISEKIDMTSMVGQGRIADEALPSNRSSGHDSATEKCPSQTPNMVSSISIKEQRLEGMPDPERNFFPVEAGPDKDSGPKDNSMSMQVISSKAEGQLPSGCPSLDLTLGCEKRSPKQRIEPLSELLAKKNDHGKGAKIMEDDSLSNLSLSLAVPSCSGTI